MLCGPQNCGKTTFCDRYFKEIPGCTIISIDEAIFEELEAATLNDTRASIRMKAWSKIKQKMWNAHNEGKTIVYDSTTINFERRVSEILEFARIFQKIYLIVIDIDENELKRHGEKITPVKALRYGLCHPNQEMCIEKSKELKNQIKENLIKCGADEVFLITSLDLERGVEVHLTN